MTVHKTCPCGRTVKGTLTWTSHTRTCRDYLLSARNRLALALASYDAMDRDDYPYQALTATQRQLARIERLLAAWPEGEERPAPESRPNQPRTALRPRPEEDLAEGV